MFQGLPVPVSLLRGPPASSNIPVTPLVPGSRTDAAAMAAGAKRVSHQAVEWKEAASFFGIRNPSVVSLSPSPLAYPAEWPVECPQTEYDEGLCLPPECRQQFARCLFDRVPRVGRYPSEPFRPLRIWCHSDTKDGASAQSMVPTARVPSQIFQLFRSPPFCGNSAPVFYWRGQRFS